MVMVMVTVTVAQLLLILLPCERVMESPKLFLLHVNARLISR
eukprot:COSAG06_NODE_3223_length_5656_cov_23.309340_5_plen_42_part_00